MADLPKISVITVVLNRQHDIRFTLESVVHQSYSNVEYIVIDGQSKDGTLEIIAEYQSKIAFFSSEKDLGIYDAMNKGLQKATGDYVLFINGGDALHHRDVLKQLAGKFLLNKPYPDIIYGECMFVDQNRREVGIRSVVRRNPLPEKLNKNSFLLGSNVTHQCFIIKKALAPMYNLQYQLSSDLDWMLNGIENAKYIVKFDGVIADFVLGDASSQHFGTSFKERFIIWTKHYGWLKTLFAHLFILLLSVKNKLFK